MIKTNGNVKARGETLITSTASTDKYAPKRLAMVERQIRRRGVQDERLLVAMEKIPRHMFVPPKFRDKAYHDEPLPIGHDQTISQPYIVAYMVEQLNLQGYEKVLEIGTGSGYQTAILAELAKQVFTIEILADLSQRAESLLERLDYQNVIFSVGDGYEGWLEEAPFDAIIVSAAASHIPPDLIQQLKFYGRMMIPVGDFEQDLYLITKTDGGIKKIKKMPVRFVPMTGRAKGDTD